MDDERPVANNAPKYDYRCRRCGFTDESHIRETLIWACPICAENPDPETGERTFPLHRLFTAPAMPRVWHGHHCMTTGKWITDRKQFREELHIASDEATQRTGMEHRFVEADASDHKSLNITEQGMDSTHDAHVKLGYKESRGRFVFPMAAPSAPRREYTADKPKAE